MSWHTVDDEYGDTATPLGLLAWIAGWAVVFGLLVLLAEVCP